MQECLGISITDKLIRYAKVQKNNNIVKVETFGIKFYDDLETTIKQIIEETNSAKVPISIDLKNEKYYYFNIFNLTNKNYADKAILTEFESFCTENHLNKNAFMGRYIYSRNIQNQDQSRVMYIYDNKTNLNEREQYFKQNKIASETPISTTLPNLLKIEKNKNVLIVNLEDITTITEIINQSIYNVDIFQEGMGTILDKINEKENSYSRSYEVCKNSTIYTMETSEVNEQNNQYLKYIIPTLYKVVEGIQRIKEEYKRIDEIYITGTGSVINNIDLYFKEYFKESKVEILKPFFSEDEVNINIKDYIEVNSAIALALQGLGFGIKNLNFNSSDWKANLLTLLTSDVKTIEKPKVSIPKPHVNLNLSLNSTWDRVERMMVMDCIMLLIIVIVYGIGSIAINNQLKEKIAGAESVRLDTEKQIIAVNSDDAKINTKATDYQKNKTNLQNTSSAIETKRSRKNQITTLLNQIVYIIPKEVQLTEIKNDENTSGTTTIEHITIYAQSTKYEQLAYFKAQLKSKNVLNNITSTEGTKDENTIKIAIEGDLKSY